MCTRVFIILKALNRNQSTRELINVWGYTVVYHKAVERKELLGFTTTWKYLMSKEG
jgi:hypothetical protein